MVIFTVKGDIFYFIFLEIVRIKNNCTNVRFASIFVEFRCLVFLLLIGKDILVK